MRASRGIWNVAILRRERMEWNAGALITVLAVLGGASLQRLIHMSFENCVPLRDSLNVSSAANSGSNLWAKVYPAGSLRRVYAVRCLASLVDRQTGILHTTNLVPMNSLYEGWRKCFEGGGNDRKLRSRLEKMGRMKPLLWPAPIKEMALWDIVGAVGVPMPWGRHQLSKQEFVFLSFVKDDFPRTLNNALHTPALNEQQNSHRSILWLRLVIDANLSRFWFQVGLDSASLLKSDRSTGAVLVD
ncbi:uncharacterized protein A1O5_06522 [Cladophialophora psammophila CBS 110553]|uniref:T6SS Phospholipase effector Tle1-like catalytic domain-containing protein n=1 Tax=Cladophialophora psammophila CBS 110553 TaxID=1182543 RepID=W9WRB3_9EURO|nr:uncharacterized protein A1O5_06522 [Cladophialophora psammophila CBS 110553]EXJ70453.1 hypothetical protein A1O5_06522 [Cladophialophora psammophila CBS 110553]